MSSMSGESSRLPEVLWLYLELSQYPILADEIRERMRKELFSRGVIDPEDFQREVEEKAVLSQRREGLDPFSQEPGEIWQKRLRPPMASTSSRTWSKLKSIHWPCHLQPKTRYSIGLSLSNRPTSWRHSCQQMHGMLAMSK